MTLAHPVAVLPLRRFGLPMAAMVIGSMVPDVPLFLRWSSGYQVSHSTRSAIGTASNSGSESHSPVPDPQSR
jgi:hypothetical protein